MIAALIVAAGSGVRMDTRRRKQYLDLAGRPILARTLAAFDRHRRIDAIFMAVPDQEAAFCRQHILAAMNLRCPVHLVAGGRRRQDSVANGLGAMPEKGIVLIHDGVRPFVDDELIGECIDGARRWGACIPGLPPADTVKQVDEKCRIAQTVARKHIRLAQTPQAFDLDLIRKAHRQAARDGLAVTDDAGLVEHLGHPVHVIPGRRFNIKITTPEDLPLAEAIHAFLVSPTAE